MASTTSSSPLPSGRAIFTKMPDLLFIPEIVAGGLVWTLLAATDALVYIPRLEGWVVFVSIFCFVVTTIWLICFASGVNQKGAYWPTLDVAYHAIATAFYLSAAVLLAIITSSMSPPPLTPHQSEYRHHVAAVVMAYTATLLYAVHTVLSAIRWKSS
ncbi:hypothetical protein SKAU_G00181150 [Synaphobranchus kaupii]|uniref:Myelin and lymphocyte protein n=1 Tax=Synaphobranchus kaupii TaxID=118154 RepID=A0A9Q1J1P3_SYNKA|nr:hypothetical protein SKAU_G00181150 [Synaphobranchus kaupii]